MEGATAALSSSDGDDVDNINADERTKSVIMP